MQKLKADIFVIGIILIAALLFFVIPGVMNRPGENGEVEFWQDGELLYSYSLSEDRIVSVQTSDGGYNLVLINGGSARVTDADCPDKLCIRQRSISKNGESIICLPHKLVVQITSGKESDLDAVAN